MRWKKVEYPYCYTNDVEWMKKARINFEKFINLAEITKMDDFNFGYDISKVFRGENPRYNPYLMDTCIKPDHMRNIFYAPGTRLYTIGFPYRHYDGIEDSELEELQKFCDKYNVCCTIFPEEYSFYHNPNTLMIIFSHKEELENLIELYGLNKLNLHFLEPKINFYNFMIEKFIDDDNVLGDLAKDMKDDKDMPENKNNDKLILNHIYWQAHSDLYVNRAIKNALKSYSNYKNNILRNKEE